MALPAPSWAALYDFPGNVSAAWGAILAANKTTLIGSDTLADADQFLFGPRGNLAKEIKDRIEYSATAFTQNSDQQVQATATTGRPFFFADYAGIFYTSVITPRGATGDAAVNSAAAEHGNRVGFILALLQSAAQKFTHGASGNLPYYEVVSIDAQAVPRAEPEATEDVDRTDIVAAIRLWVRPDAFPASLP